jgi:DNA-binding response OmpR family regulator
MIDTINPDFGRRLVLVVDDDFRLRLFIRTVLGIANARVLEAGDGFEALQLFRLCRGDLALVITDVRMPRMSGTELANSIRLDSDIPLIFISGEPAPVNSCDLNRFWYVEKPFGARTLLEAVSACFELTPAAG